VSELDELFEDIFEEEKKEEESIEKAEEKKEESISLEQIKPKQEEVKEENTIAKEIVPVKAARPEQTQQPQATETEGQISIRALRPALPAQTEEEFVIEEVAEPAPKEVILIYGHKGHGKTYLAMSFPGTKVVLSFDRKSAMVKYKDYKGDKRIHVYDVVRYMDYSTSQKFLESADKTFRYLNVLLDHISQNPPDWIVIDGSEIFQQICEMTMRYRNNLMPFQGIANLNLWKERRLYIRQIHNKCLSIARRGIIYTTYVDKDEIVVDGEIIARKDVPKWIDAIMYETDTVIRVIAVSTDAEGGGKKFIATVESSKGSLPTGLRADITDAGYSALIKALEGG